MSLAELCALLKQKREEKGLTVEQVVDKTKLYPSAIRDIEEGNITSINPTYLKGFLKIYASFLGVPIENALDEISAGSKPKKERKEKKEGTEKKFTFQFKAIEIPAHVKRTALLIAAALLAFWLLVSFVRFIASHIPKGGPKKSARSVEAAAPVVQARPQVSKDVTVSLTAKRNCYVKVKVDGKMLYSGLISRGKVETWKGSREIEFRISDGSAVYLEVNGKSLPPLTSMRKVIKSLKVTSSGISVSK